MAVICLLKNAVKPRRIHSKRRIFLYMPFSLLIKFNQFPAWYSHNIACLKCHKILTVCLSFGICWLILGFCLRICMLSVLSCSLWSSWYQRSVNRISGFWLPRHTRFGWSGLKPSNLHSNLHSFCFHHFLVMYSALQAITYWDISRFKTGLEGGHEYVWKLSGQESVWGSVV